MEEDLKATGISSHIAAGLIEMYAYPNLYRVYEVHKLITIGKVKLDDCEKEFAAVYQNK